MKLKEVYKTREFEYRDKTDNNNNNMSRKSITDKLRKVVKMIIKVATFKRSVEMLLQMNLA